jgi:hypothetical protein
MTTAIQVLNREIWQQAQVHDLLHSVRWDARIRCIVAAGVGFITAALLLRGWVI